MMIHDTIYLMARNTEYLFNHTHQYLLKGHAKETSVYAIKGSYMNAGNNFNKPCSITKHAIRKKSSVLAESVVT